MSIEKENKGRYRLQSRDGWVGGSADSLREKSTNFFFFFFKISLLSEKPESKKKKNSKLVIISPLFLPLCDVCYDLRVRRETERNGEREDEIHTHTRRVRFLINLSSHQLQLATQNSWRYTSWDLLLFSFSLRFFPFSQSWCFGTIRTFAVLFFDTYRGWTTILYLELLHWYIYLSCKILSKKNKNTYGLFSSSDGGM